MLISEVMAFKPRVKRIPTKIPIAAAMIIRMVSITIKLRCGKLAFGDIVQQRSADRAFEAGRLLGFLKCHIR